LATDNNLVFRKLGHVCLVVALLAAIGGHWAVLQTLAWTNMLAENLQTASLSEAVEKTFDGKHPCCLCKAITQGKKSEKKRECPVQLKKMEFILERLHFVFCPPQDFRLLPERSLSADDFASQPPVPPPRELIG
jgi:hypothetical protein